MMLILLSETSWRCFFLRLSLFVVSNCDFFVSSPPSRLTLSALQCSSTCAGGFQRRVVVCQDAAGRSSSYCDERVKPAESKSCDSGPCPLWNYGVWGEVRLSGTSFSFHLSLQQMGIRNLPFPLSVHPNLRRGTEDSPRGVSEAQWPEAERLQL